MYDAVNHGRLKPRSLARPPAFTPLPRAADGRIVLAVDVSNRLRPDAIVTAMLDAVRLGPADDATAVTAAQPFSQIGLLSRRDPEHLRWHPAHACRPSPPHRRHRRSPP
jgi:hypothetical protein